MQYNLWFQIGAALTMMFSLVGLAAAFLLNTDIVPWALSIMIAYGIIRVEQLHKKLEKIDGIVEV